VINECNDEGDEEDDKELTENYRNNNVTQKNSLYFLNGIIDLINLRHILSLTPIGLYLQMIMMMIILIMMIMMVIVINI